VGALPVEPAGVAGQRQRCRAEQRRRHTRRRLLLAADAVALLLALTATQLATGETPGAPPGAALLLLAVPAWMALAQGLGLYGRDLERPSHTTTDELLAIVLLVTLLAWVGVLAASLVDPEPLALDRWALLWAFAMIALTLGRTAARALGRRLPAYRQRALVVGAGATGQLVARKLVHHPEYGVDVVGFVDGNAPRLRRDLAQLPFLGRPADVAAIAAAGGVDRVIVSLTGEPDRVLEDAVARLQRDGVQVDIVPRLHAALGPGTTVTTVEELHLVTVPATRTSRVSLAVKRVLDVLLASAALVVLAPVLALLALLVKRSSPGPVLFRQTRLGLHQRPFTFLKFRTMAAGTSPEAHRAYVRRAADPDALPEDHGLFKLEQAGAVTGVGAWLRRTSLDELPQLLNVLRGDMSLVGPRPCIPYELEHFAPKHFERFAVPAGITGLWQARARAHATFAEALDLDVAYARSRSLALDFRLLLETPLQMLRGGGTR
jgi:exopolysaccharide biosynthesis polyprenyl glycosylphosphotransferase